MKALTYTEPGRFELIEKPKPEIIDPKDAVVKVTLSSICSSDLHILHGAVPQAEWALLWGMSSWASLRLSVRKSPWSSRATELP